MSDLDHIVKIDEHYETFLKLQKQRQDELFCDVILQVQERSFPAHKNVLAAASEYFMKMFTIDMKEKHNEEIAIESVTAKAMDEILDCIYTGKFSLSDDSITEILHAASLMQLTSLLEAVDNFMQSSLKAENSCLYLKLATLYSFQDVADDANKFFLKEFCQVSDEPDFLQYCVDKIDDILVSDDLLVKKEETVFNFMIKWVNRDLEQRKQHFPRLFQCVRLQFVPIQFVIDVIRNNVHVKENAECRDLVEDAFSYHILPTVFTAQIRRHCFAPNPDSVMLLPYEKKYQAVYNTTDKIWNNILYEGLTENTILKNCAVAFSHPVTILCGGTTKSNKASKQVVRFDSVQWMEMPPMNEARCGSVSVFHDENLYVFEGETFPVSPNSTFSPGQRNPDAQNFSTTYEIFERDSRKWSIFPTLLEISRSYGAAQAVGDKIYLIGGYTTFAEDVQQSNTPCKLVCGCTLTFCPADKTWDAVGCLNEARAKFGCAVLGSHIYVVGGYSYSGSNIISVEVLNTAENIWTRSNFGICSNRYSYHSAPISIAACCVFQTLWAVAGQDKLQKSVKGEKWSQESAKVLDSGIIIPFSSWYANQSFVKIRGN